MTLFAVIIILIAFFLAANAVIFFSLTNLFLVKNLLSENEFHLKKNNISIIISARNESKNISSLIESLKKIDYPQSNFEVVLIDDHSDDNTYSLAESSIAHMGNFFILKNRNAKRLGKKGALTFGITKARFPFIIITDADCNPNAGWLKSFSQKFNEGNDFVFGAAPSYTSNKFRNNIFVFENLRTSILTFGLAQIKLPYSAAARSFGFKKNAFEEIGGYKNTLETLSGDDDLLLREAVKNKMNIGLVTEKDAFVFSSAKETFKEYFIQKTRHTKTSFYYLPKQKLVLSFWHLLNLIFLFSIVFVFADFIFILPFLIKIICDALVVLSFQKKFGYDFSFWEILFLQITYELIIVINFFNALFRKDKWK